MTFISYFNAATLLLAGLIWIGSITFLLKKKRKNVVYLCFFTIFYIYLLKVLDYTLFQFQSLLLLKHFMPGLMLNGEAASKSINLIPLVTLTIADIKTSLLNILLFIPFGFGLPFITRLRMKGVLIMGLLCSVSIEILQFITGSIAGITFRVADVNDVIFNTLGLLIGHLLFIGFSYGYRWATKGRVLSNHISRYLDEQLY